MTSGRYFYLTIGPVQEFVAQARRTRDFWAGSFLLSTLAAVAMREVEAQGGEILFPKPDPEFMKALGGQSSGGLPRQGLIPNRFKASVADAFSPEDVCAAVRHAWLEIARLAWRRIPSDLRDTHRGLRRVWSRQIGVDLETGLAHGDEPFWQLSWALGAEGDGEDLLDRRKNLRIRRKPGEPGCKCILMDGWQELSGAPRDDKELARFWERLRGRINLRNKSDLRDDERLCALSLVKRLFPSDFARLQVKMPTGWTLHGWEIETNVPSSAYLAAAPWLARAIRLVDEGSAERFFDVSRGVGQDGEKRTRLRMVRDAATSCGEHAARLATLDGDLFFDSTLANPLEFPERTMAEAVRERLKDLHRLADSTQGEGARLGEPSPYFAVLAMDGDELGRHMADPQKQEGISDALARFTSQVPDIVSAHSGFLIFAGGDDVLALFPVPEALPAARALRACYAASFEGRAVDSTISSGVLFASHKLPLTHVLRNAHSLLDDAAKEARGRDAIAVQVSSRGGELIRWAQPWHVALGEDGWLELEGLARRMAEGEAPFSHSFFHRVDDLLRLINPDTGRGTVSIGNDAAVELFTAELLDSGLYKDIAREEGSDSAPASVAPSAVDRARSHVRTLLHQCRPQKRSISGQHDVARFEPESRIEADGAFLVRFLERHHRRTDA